MKGFRSNAEAFFYSVENPGQSRNSGQGENSGQSENLGQTEILGLTGIIIPGEWLQKIYIFRI